VRLERARLDAVFASPWLLGAVVALSFFWQIGALPLYDLDEGAFTEATREMIASGNYITPHRDGEPRYDKPVLIYWAQAASVKTLGFNELALRLPSALAASLWVWALWVFVRERLDTPTATVAGMVMSLSLLVALVAKAAVADALLNLFIALTFFEVYRFYARPGADNCSGPVLRAWLWMGLGFLTKGPVAVFFPGLVSLLFFWSEGALGRWRQAILSPLGWLIFVLTAGPWYLAVYLDDGGGFFRSFFLHHNAERFGDTIHGHRGFFGYYLVMLPLILLPFTGWFLRLLIPWRTAWRAAWADPLERFLWLWFLTVLVVFSFSGTKLPHYLLYGCTPLFILMARHRDLLTGRWLALTPPLLLFGLLLALPWLLNSMIFATPKPHEAAMITEGRAALDWTYLVWVGAGAAAVLGLAFWRGPAVWQRLILAGIIQVLVISGVLAPRVFEVLQGPVKEAATWARRLDLPTVTFRTSMPSFSVYRGAITVNRTPRPGELVFLRVDKLQQLDRELPDLRIDLIYRRGPVALMWVRDLPRPTGATHDADGSDG
jgi:4-amino-4-deoxy-L-arabinose transferase-like glycosyltransferase